MSAFNAGQGIAVTSPYNGFMWHDAHGGLLHDSAFLFVLLMQYTTQSTHMRAAHKLDASTMPHNLSDQLGQLN
jgi:hypothetical protein